jgi:glutamyl-tRNA reductase
MFESIRIEFLLDLLVIYIHKGSRALIYIDLSMPRNVYGSLELIQGISP